MAYFTQGPRYRNASFGRWRQSNGAIEGYLITETSPANPDIVETNVPQQWMRRICKPGTYTNLGQVLRSPREPNVEMIRRDFYRLREIVQTFKAAMGARYTLWKKAVFTPVAEKGRNVLFFPGQAQDPSAIASPLEYLRQRQPEQYAVWQAFLNLDKWTQQALRKIDAGIFLAGRERKPSIELLTRWDMAKRMLDKWKSEVSPEVRKELGLGAAAGVLAIVIASAIVLSIVGVTVALQINTAMRAVTGHRETEEVIDLMKAYQTMILSWQKAGIKVDGRKALEDFTRIFEHQMKPTPPPWGAIAGWGGFAVALVFVGVGWAGGWFKPRRRAPAPRVTVGAVGGER